MYKGAFSPPGYQDSVVCPPSLIHLQFTASLCSRAGGHIDYPHMCCMRGNGMPGQMWAASGDLLSGSESYKGDSGLHPLLRVFRCVAA